MATESHCLGVLTDTEKPPQVLVMAMHAGKTCTKEFDRRDETESSS